MEGAYMEELRYETSEDDALEEAKGNYSWCDCFLVAIFSCM